MTTVIDVVDMGYAFTALVVVIGVLLIAGAYVNYTRNNIPLAMLCGGTLLMLISPLLAIIILAVAAIIIAIGGDTRNALMTVLCAAMFAVPASLLRAACGGQRKRGTTGDMDA